MTADNLPDTGLALSRHSIPSERTLWHRAGGSLWGFQWGSLILTVDKADAGLRGIGAHIKLDSPVKLQDNDCSHGKDRVFFFLGWNLLFLLEQRHSALERIGFLSAHISLKIVIEICRFNFCLSCCVSGACKRQVTWGNVGSLFFFFFKPKLLWFLMVK